MMAELGNRGWRTEATTEGNREQVLIGAKREFTIHES